MKIKKIISTLLIVVILVIAGFFLYKTFFGSSKKTDTASTSTTATKDAAPVAENILPHGTKLDFGPVKKFNPDNHIFPYSKVRPEDTGLELNQIITSTEQ